MGTERRTGGGREAVPGVPGSEGQPRGATGRGLRGPGGIPPFSPRLPVPRARTSGSRRGEASSAAPRRPQAGGGARSAAGPGARRGGGRRGRLLLLPRGHGGGGGASGAAGARSPPLTRKLAHTSRNRNRHRSDP